MRGKGDFEFEGTRMGNKLGKEQQSVRVDALAMPSSAAAASPSVCCVIARAAGAGRAP